MFFHKSFIIVIIQMTQEGTKQTISIIQQESCTNQLISSIQRKLNTFFQSKPDLEAISKEKSFNLKSESKPAKQKIDKMNLNELEQSCRQSDKKKSSVLFQINKMELFYCEKIKALELKISFLEGQNEDLRQKLRNVLESNDKLSNELKMQKTNNTQKFDKATKQIESSLLHKFGNEAESFYNKLIYEKQISQQQLNREKLKRINLEDQYQILKEEKENLEIFYRNLVESHRRLLKVDIQKTKIELKNSSNQSCQYSQKYEMEDPHKQIKQELELIKSRTKELKKTKKKLKNEIPELISEIKSIKKTLKLH